MNRAGWTVPLVAIAVACSASAPKPQPEVVTRPTPAPEGLVLELSPTHLGAQTPGTDFVVSATLVNRSTSQHYSIPRPGPNAWLGIAAPLRYSFEVAADDGWKPLPVSFFSGHPAPFEKPGELIRIAPGERVVLDAGVPPLEFPDDVVGHMRAQLTYDIGGEMARHSEDSAAPSKRVLTSNAIEVNQIPGPLELILETLAPVIATVPLDPSQILRVTLRNRSKAAVTIYGPGGITAGVGFNMYTPNGEDWPKGDRPVMNLAPEPAKKTVLEAGQSIELFGPSPALGATSGTWTYPVVETFRIRALFSQPGPGQTMHYSNWVTITSRR